MIHENDSHREKIDSIKRATVEMMDSFTVARFQLVFDVNTSQFMFFLTTEQRTPGQSADANLVQQASLTLEGHFYKRVCWPNQSQPLEEKAIDQEIDGMQARQMQQKELILIESLEETLRAAIEERGESWNALLSDRKKVRELVDGVIHSMQNQII